MVTSNATNLRMDPAAGKRNEAGDGQRVAPIARSGGRQGDETNPIEAAEDIDARHLKAGGAQRGGEDLGDGFDVAEVELATAEMRGGPADLPSAKGIVYRSSRNEDRVPIGKRRRHEGVEEFVFVAGDLGHAGELIGQVGVPIAGERGQQAVADAVAGEAGVGIGGVDAPVMAVLAEVGYYLGTGAVQERADDSLASDG